MTKKCAHTDYERRVDESYNGCILCDNEVLRGNLSENAQTIEQLHAAVKTAQELAATRLQEVERLREVLTIPNITPDTTSSALFIRTLSEHEKGQPVNGQDLINALMWRVKNQRKEIARLQEKRGSPEPRVCASRDADHCDYPDCEHHWELVVDWALAAMKKLHESAEPDTDHPEIPAIVPAAAFRAFVDEHARLMRIRASAPQGASRDASSEKSGERYWMCSCEPPGNFNIESVSICKDCGTVRPPTSRT